MVKIEENKVLSVLVNSEFEVQVSDVDRQCPIVFFVANGEPEYVDTLYLSKDITTIEELKIIATGWYESHVKNTKVFKAPKHEAPTIAQLNLHSEEAMRVDIKGIQFIIGKEVPILQIIKNDEVVTDYIEVGYEYEIHDIADLERYAIKWYYKNELGIDF